MSKRRVPAPDCDDPFEAEAFLLALVCCDGCNRVLAEPTYEQGSSLDVFYTWCREVSEIARREEYEASPHQFN